MISILLAGQLAVLFLIMGCGFLLVKLHLVRSEESRTLSVITLYLIMPCVILNAFQIDYSREIRDGFPAFLDQGLKENPMKCEYFLPAVVSGLVEKDQASVAVLKSADKWYGVTYKEDKPVVVAALRRMKEEGLYPMHLWEE